MSIEEKLESSFQNITQYIISYFQNKDDSLLNEVKDFFSSFINSVRKLEQVENVHQLLALLKRNGLFEAHECSSLRIFLKVIHEEDFAKMVGDHNVLLNSSTSAEEPRTNIYRKRRELDSEQALPQPPSSPPKIFTLQPSQNAIRNEIFKLISRSISVSDFRRIARHLCFKENEIKNLEISVMEQETRTMVLLSKYEEREQRIDFRKIVGILNFLGMKSVADGVKEILARN